MNFPIYKLYPNDDFTVFQFVSLGSKGQILKVIRFYPTSNPKVYNLGLADVRYVDEKEGVITVDDQRVSNNGDIEKIMRTVASSICIFGQHYPDIFVLFGSGSPVRRRLYRMIMQKYFVEISKTFILFGAKRQDDGKIVNVPFCFNVNGDGFFIKFNI